MARAFTLLCALAGTAEEKRPSMMITDADTRAIRYAIDTNRDFI